MSSKATTHSLRLTRTIDASRDRVFRAWTEAEKLKQWSAPEGATIPEVEVDLRVGGRYRIRMVTPDGATHTAVGTYREITPPARLVYTWSWEETEDDDEGGESLVTVEFRERGESTEVVLQHDRFATPEDRDGHEKGWVSCLDRLAKLF